MHHTNSNFTDTATVRRGALAPPHRAVLASLLLLGGCCGADLVSPQERTLPLESKALDIAQGPADLDETGDAGPSEGDAGEEEPPICDEVPVTASFIVENVASTDWSGLVRIDSADAVGENGGPPASRGYVNHRYRVTVLETFRGEPRDSLVFLVMAEADIAPMKPGRELLASLCEGSSDAYYSPDNGYVLPAPAPCAAAVRALAPSFDTGASPTACEE